MKLPSVPLFSQQVGDPESLHLLKRILAETLRPHWRAYAKAFFFMAVMAASISLTAWLMRDVVNQIFIDRDTNKLYLLTASILVLFAARGWSTYMQSVSLAKVGNRIVAYNQQRVFDHLLKMDIQYLTGVASSDLIMRVSNGAQAARNVVNLIVQSLGRDALTLIGLTAVMVVQAPLLSLIALITGPIAIYGITGLTRRVRGLASAEMQTLAELIAVIQETTHGSRILKAFRLERYMRGRMEKAVLGIEMRANKIATLEARTAPLMDTLAGVAIAAVVFIAGWQSIHGDQSPGAFMSFITALLLAYEPAKRLARLQVTLAADLVVARMMMELLDQPVGPTEVAEILPPLKVDSGRIEFRDVGFGYRVETPVVTDLTLVARRGQRVALVGPTGAGKSTLFSLLQRFYDVQTGAILIDGTDIRQVSTTSLRSAISYVSQDTYLFTGSVRENIRLGRLNASDDEVEQAARDAHAEEFILGLSQGYDSTVGENGAQLSGGQKQRLAIARALLKDAPIVLLDEATSALDSATEYKIRDAVNRLTGGRTTLVIAHRLATVVDADWILVIEAGRVVEEGRHEDLWRKGGLYEELCRLQFAEPTEPYAAVT